MRNLRTLMVTLAATAAIVSLVGCDDDGGAATDKDGSAGAGGVGGDGGEGGGGAGGGGNEGGEGGQGGGGAGGGGNEGGEGGIGGGEGGQGGGGAGGDGGDGGGVVPVDDTCEPDGTSPDTAVAAEPGEFGPSGVIVALDAPNTPTDAFAAGCNLYGASAGSALAGAEALVGDGGDNLNSLVEPDENGEATVTLLAQLLQIEAGDTGNSRIKSGVAFYTGNRTAEGDLQISRSSFVGGDPSAEPLISFDDACTCNSELKAPGSDFALSLPIIDGLPPLDLTLNKTRFNGGLAFTGDGFSVSDGVLAGYLTRDTLLEVINALNVACSAENPPSLCDTIGDFLQGDPDTTITLLLGLLGLNGFDVEIGANGEPAECAAGGANCNAIGVCLQVELRAAKISGVEPE